MSHEIPPSSTAEDVVEQSVPEIQEHTILNVPILLTEARPVMGAVAAVKLLRGEQGVSPWLAGMALTDFLDGKVARAIDRWSIQRTGQRNGYGTTEAGKRRDPIADTISFMEVAPALLKSPRTSALGKTAVGVVLIGEGIKGMWAFRANHAHQTMYDKRMEVDVSGTGKAGATARFIAVLGAALTHDLEPGKARTAAGIGALGAAIAGGVLGEKARRGYSKVLAEKGIVVSMVPAFLRRKGQKAETTEMAA